MRTVLTALVFAAHFLSSLINAAEPVHWAPIGLSGGSAMFAPAISSVYFNLVMANCDMSAAYISERAFTIFIQGVSKFRSHLIQKC